MTGGTDYREEREKGESFKWGGGGSEWWGVFFDFKGRLVWGGLQCGISREKMATKGENGG